jgi:hypothetical protein
MSARIATAKGAGPRDVPAAAAVRTHRRLGRTFSRSRWREYRRLLTLALQHGYAVVSLEAWLEDSGAYAGRDVMVLRHDVDQCPASALRMAAIEAELGLHSTWYFRWRTAQPAVVAAVREGGHAVGLHFETLTRELLRRGLPPARAPALVPEARELLREELVRFAALHGPARSACPHGDTRVPGVHNGVLLRGEDLSTYGVRWEAHAAIGRHPLDVWLTDRSSAQGRWKDAMDPIDLLIDRRSPILAVVHPNNWVSGLGLWWDRMLPERLGASGSDDPPAIPPSAS